MSWHVYLLACADGTLYCGVTTHVARRVEAHNAGTGAKYTRARLPVRLAACVPAGDKPAALRLEMRVKRLRRAEKLPFVLSLPGASAQAPEEDA